MGKNSNMSSCQKDYFEFVLVGKIKRKPQYFNNAKSFLLYELSLFINL